MVIVMKDMESLQDFLNRINSFNQNSLPKDCDMQTNTNLLKKVDTNGKLLNYSGNTIVFYLPEDVKEKIYLIQQKLYDICGDILAEQLTKDSFHITLHDLLNGIPSENLQQEILKIQPLAIKILDNKTDIIRMKSNFLFNMVNTSMVLGFEPVDNDSHKTLMRYYQDFQNVVNLDYSLTPHVTIAYFKPQIINKNQVENLQIVIDWVKAQKSIYFDLSGSMLKYQTFTNMNNYKTVI